MLVTVTTDDIRYNTSDWPGMVTPQRALTGVLEPKMDQTGRQGLHGFAK